MSCRESRAGSALTTIARLESGADDVATLSTFHALRADIVARSAAAPDDAVYAAFLNDQIIAVQNNPNFTDARRRSILARIEAAREQRPDGRTFSALQRIRGRMVEQVEILNTRIASIASGLDVEESVARARLAEIVAATPRGRRGATPEGYTEQIAATSRAGNGPTDPATVMALRQLDDEAYRARADRALNGPQRIVRSSIGSGLFAEAGYDPNGGRLELVFRGRGDRPNSRVYAYRGVPAHVWERMQTGEGSRTYNDMIRGRAEYQYGTQTEADLDSAARRCSDCGQFAAAGHHCPPRIQREEAAAQAAQQAREAAQRAAREAEQAAERDRAAAAERAAAAAQQAEELAQGRPEVREARDAGIWGYGRTSRPNRGAATGRADGMRMSPVTAMRAEAVNGPIRGRISYGFGNRLRDSEDGLPVTAWATYVRGTAVFDRPGRGQYTVSDPQLRCECPQYRENGDCPHINYVLERVRSAWAPATASRSTQPLTEADIARAQRAAEEALRHDWMRNEETAAEAARSWAPSAPQDRYSETFESFEEDYKAALQRKKDGEAPIPYMTSNALGGDFTRASGKGFGVELEFDFPNSVDRYSALSAIGRDLYAAGLTHSEYQQGYHASARRGYVDTHAGNWSYEKDCTVAGEIVSPIMYDEPETWENIAKVCEIVKRHGGKASVKTGSHVHVSSPNTTLETATELRRMVNQHEDVMYRISQDPQRGKHRPMRWCGPNTEVPSDGYRSIEAARAGTGTHGFGLNMAAVSGGGGDHPEIRHWDGTLDPSVIQAQIKVSAAMVEAAVRNGANGGSPLRRREPVGTHKARAAATFGNSRRALTSAELKEDSATARSFIDTLFTRREDKAQVAALFAVTKWT